MSTFTPSPTDSFPDRALAVFETIIRSCSAVSVLYSAFTIASFALTMGAEFSRLWIALAFPAAVGFCGILFSRPIALFLGKPLSLLK